MSHELFLKKSRSAIHTISCIDIFIEILVWDLSQRDLIRRSSTEIFIRILSESVSLILTRSFEISNVFKRFKFAAAVRGPHPEQYARTRRSGGGGGGGGSRTTPEDGHHKGMLAESNAQPSLTNTYEGLIRFTRPHMGLSRLHQWCYLEHIWRRWTWEDGARPPVSSVLSVLKRLEDSGLTLKLSSFKRVQVSSVDVVGYYAASCVSSRSMRDVWTVSEPHKKRSRPARPNRTPSTRS